MQKTSREALMRELVAIAALAAATALAAPLPASAQDAAAAKKPAAKTASAKAKPSAPNPAEMAALKESYATMPLAERLAIQSDLVWSGDYNGGVNGDFGERSIAAVKAFQKKHKAKETGLLTPQERESLAAAVKAQREQVGWTLIEDEALPGARLGIPAKFAAKSERGASGTRWFSARGEIQIETFREKMGGAQLSELFEEQKKQPKNRRVEYNVLRSDFFVLSGLQGLKKFYVRAQLKDNEARGLTILYDQAMDGIMEPVVVAMSSAFAPFGSDAAEPVRRAVEYASGIIVSSAGHIITERQATDDCRSIVVAGHGHAERIAEEKNSDLALLRLHGAAHIRALPLSTESPKGADLVLIGVADPKTQAGGTTVSVSPAKLRGVEGTRVLLDATPAQGFAGAAALDGQGQFVGMLDVNSIVIAGSSAATPQSALVPGATIRKFLEASNVMPVIGRADIETAKAAVTRVICVRK
jgi:peptidoglycan hydrolase-like protein with peptidoglycan-binding domain